MKEEIKLEEYYKFPLEDRGYSYVYDGNNNLAFMFMLKSKDDKVKLLEVINGKSKITRGDFKFRYDNYSIYLTTPDVTDYEVIIIRGWGRLTGIGGLNLSADKAVDIQDAFGKFIVDKLNKRN